MTENQQPSPVPSFAPTTLSDQAKARIFDAEEHARLMTANYAELLNRLLAIFGISQDEVSSVEELLEMIAPKETIEEA